MRCVLTQPDKLCQAYYYITAGTVYRSSSCQHFLTFKFFDLNTSQKKNFVKWHFTAEVWKTSSLAYKSFIVMVPCPSHVRIMFTWSPHFRSTVYIGSTPDCVGRRYQSDNYQQTPMIPSYRQSIFQIQHSEYHIVVNMCLAPSITSVAPASVGFLLNWKVMWVVFNTANPPSTASIAFRIITTLLWSRDCCIRRHGNGWNDHNQDL